MMAAFFSIITYRLTLLIITLECLCMAVWILVFHRLWVRFHPPVSTVLICDDEKRGWEIAEKINRRSFTNRINTVCAYDETKFTKF